LKTECRPLGPEESHKNDQRVGTPLLRGKADTVEAVEPGEKKAPGRPYCSLSVLKRNMGTDFLVGPVVITQRAMALNEKT